MTPPDIEPEAGQTPAEPTPPETPESPAPTETPETVEVEEDDADRRKRRLLLLLLLLLLLCLCCAGGLFLRYLLKPEPLPALLPTQVAACYAPTYKFSITNVDGPVAVAVSPDDQRIYVAESNGDRLVKMFDRNGNLITSFAPPGTDKANREPKYMAVGPDGRVYLADRTSAAIDIYDADGKFIDAIIGQHLTLTKFLTGQIGTLPAGTLITHYEGINKILSYQLPGEQVQDVKVTLSDADLPWSPLGLRFDTSGNLIYTDTTEDLHSVHIIPASALSGDLAAFNPEIKQFGSQGNKKDQFDFPQTVSLDGKGNFYISDGNNSRIDIWTPDLQYKTFFGFGSSVNGALNLPRGTWMGRGGCLFVADAVGSLIRVYNVSGAEPAFAFEFGGYGIEEGKFNYPTDVFIDGTGRLYVADSANDRIQVWSF